MFGGLSLIISTQIHAVYFEFKIEKIAVSLSHFEEMRKPRIAPFQQAGNFSLLSSLLCTQL